MKIGRKRPERYKKSSEIPIEKYIKDYENGKITVVEIARKEGSSEPTINKRINEYYSKKRTGKT